MMYGALVAPGGRGCRVLLGATYDHRVKESKLSL